LRTFAHIVNPFRAQKNSDLFTAQPITFTSMQNAVVHVKSHIKVELWAAVYKEDQEVVPFYFNKTRFLQKSVLDFEDFKKPVKLPLIHEILDNLYDASTADFFIYTNIDIGLYPHFYDYVNKFIDEGYDALIINRRRLKSSFVTVSDLQFIYKEVGKKHPGFDCFIFSRKLYTSFKLANVCIGVPFIGITLAQNLFAYANKYHIYTDEVLTFHIGEEIYKRRNTGDYFIYNRREFWKAMSQLEDVHNAQKLPFYERAIIKRLFLYTLHPSIPIRWVLRLELKRFKKALKLPL
jgi:hypothetical protein